jgi:glyoxylase-like metal-dependent hydrolase (beta-lactamase superfamily II)
LEKELERFNYKLGDIQHLFLTHIHFDHAGAAWALAKNGTKVHVHPKGYKHMLDPSRLYASAKRIYGDKMEFLWGSMESIEEQNLHSVENDEEFKFDDLVIKALFTPGHAVHHIAWQIGDNIITGDVAGCKIDHGPVVPPCPPPDINIEDWISSIDLLLKNKPKALYLTHFGKVLNVDNHLNALKEILWDWVNFFKPYYESGAEVKEITPLFSAYAKDQLIEYGAAELINKYENANPAWMSVAGLMRYWAKKNPK